MGRRRHSWRTARAPSSTAAFHGGTAIDDPDWTDDTEISNVVNSKTDLCQSFFAFDVVQTGPSAGHVIAYIGVTRSDINGDASYFFVLSHGPNPDIRVDGDIVIEVDYTGQGDPNNLGYYTWDGTPPVMSDYIPVLENGVPVEVEAGQPDLSVFFDLSPVEYFGEMAIDLTGLGLAPNAFEIDSPDDCEAFGFGRAISRTGNGKTATLKDDGEPARIDVDVCGSVELTKLVDPANATGWEFEFTIAPSEGLSPDTAQTVTPADPTITWGNLVDGVEYTITETDNPADGFIHGAVVCGEGEGADNTFTAVAGETITCTATNTQLGSVDVTKTVQGTTTPWAFDFTISPVPAGETATKTSHQPGTDRELGRARPRYGVHDHRGRRRRLHQRRHLLR